MKGKSDGRVGEQAAHGQQAYSTTAQYREWVPPQGDRKGQQTGVRQGQLDLRGGGGLRGGVERGGVGVPGGDGHSFQQSNGVHTARRHPMQGSSGVRGGGGRGGGGRGEQYYVDEPQQQQHQQRRPTGGMLSNRGSGGARVSPAASSSSSQHLQHQQQQHALYLQEQQQRQHLQQQQQQAQQHHQHHQHHQHQHQQPQKHGRHQPPEGKQQSLTQRSLAAGAARYRRGGGAGDVSQQLPTSPELMGLKAHAAEFVPGAGAGAGAGGSGHKQQSRLGANVNNSIGGNSNKRLGVVGGGGGGSKPSSSRTIPAGTDNSGDTQGQGVSDLTAHAQEFVPGGGSGAMDAVEGGDGDGGGAAAVGGQGVGTVVPEKMVQVVRGGTIYFVPESEALATDELVAGAEGYGVEAAVEEGFQWVHHSTTLPAPHRRTMHSTAVPEHLWSEFQDQSLSILRQVPPDDERLKEIPPQFYAAFPLDNSSKTKGTAGSFGYPSETYKVIQHHNGQAYALRRFDTARTTPKIVALATEIWLSMPEHPGITRPREAFIHRNALIMVCDFHPGAETLAQRFMDKQGGLLSEAFIWRVICQLLGGLRATHAAGTALRNVHPSRVLYCRVGDRVRINWVGCLDVLEFETRKQVSELQQQDLHDLGMLILSLACRSPATAGTRAESINFLAQHYSHELHNLVVSLVTKPPSVFEICMATAHHTMDALETTLTANDALQCYLSNEYDNGRLLRLLLKLGTLNERPDQSGGEWAETGERYILKLFRDYCFHQVNSEDEPVIDFGHVYQTLARLDAGDEEKILLTSSDKRSLLVVSFADVKRCLDEAFADIFGQATSLRGGGPGGGGGGSGAGSTASNVVLTAVSGGAGGDGAVLPGGRGGMAMAAGSGEAGGVPMSGGMMGVDGGPVGGHTHGGHGHRMAMVMGGHGHPQSHPHAQQQHHSHHSGMGMGITMVGHHHHHHGGPPSPAALAHGRPMPPY